jgi:hypothetical protein
VTRASADHDDDVAFDTRYEAALRADDPAAALAALAAGARLAVTDEDGARIAALLVARLRFERVVQGSRRAAAFFDVDPAGFTAAFRAYHRAVAATPFDPAGEAEAFLAWCAAHAVVVP